MPLQTEERLIFNRVNSIRYIIYHHTLQFPEQLITFPVRLKTGKSDWNLFSVSVEDKVVGETDFRWIHSENLTAIIFIVAV